MALPQYSVEQLIDNIKRRCTVPTSQFTFTNEDWALLANDELQGEVVPLIMSTREEFFVDFVDVLVPSDKILDFPEETVGMKLRSVCYKQNGSPLVLINLPRIDLDVVAGSGFFNYSTFAGFYIEGNKICLYPNTSVPVNTTIRLYYYRRTLVLADPSAYGQIVSIDSMANSIQLSFIPSSWTVGTTLNAVNQKVPFNLTNEAMVIQSLSAPTIFLDNVDGLSVGDYVSELGFSAIPQIPIEAHPYLAQLTAAKALESLGDQEGMKRALDKASQLKESLLILISQRVDGSVKKVMSPNGGMRLASGLGRWGRGGSGGGGFW